MDHVLDGDDVAGREAFFLQQPGGKVRAALDVGDGVLRPVPSLSPRFLR